MTDDLERRLRASDPARAGNVTGQDASWISDLTEATMSTTLTTTTSPRRSRWVPLTAAAGVAVVLGLGAVALTTDDEGSPGPGSTLELALPGSDSMASCVAYSVEFLADMPTAFSGTATAVDDGEVTLDVDTWYRGGDAETVVLTAPAGDTVALIGSVDFAAGERYLVTASEDGTVSSCGFTSEWSRSGQADFEQAFGS